MRSIYIRGQKVILNSDLAMLYGVSTKRLNEQVKRNRKKFPNDFLFRLTKKEKPLNPTAFLHPLNLTPTTVKR